MKGYTIVVVPSRYVFLRRIQDKPDMSLRRIAGELELRCDSVLSHKSEGYVGNLVVALNPSLVTQFLPRDRNVTSRVRVHVVTIRVLVTSRDRVHVVIT